MKRVFLILVFSIILMPISSSFEQTIDKEGTLGVIFASYSPHQFKNEDGFTVVIGEIENTKNFPVTGVKIWAGFYNDIDEQPIESVIGGTILEVIPPNSKSPYMIKSRTPEPTITSVSVNLLGFDSAAPKIEQMDIEIGNVEVSTNITISGNIVNNSPIKTSNTKIHLAFYDAFDPGRILGIATNTIEEIPASATINFKFNELKHSQAVGFVILAESNEFYSDLVDEELPKQEIITKLVNINDVNLLDADGNKISKLNVGTMVTLQSRIWIQYATDQESYEQPFVYYSQIKQSGEKPFVEFIGKFEGKFDRSGAQFPSVEWTPENKGVYFIETFVWDPNAIPLASKGPIVLVIVE